MTELAAAWPAAVAEIVVVIFILVAGAVMAGLVL